MKPRIYVETTVPSFYYEVRNEPAMLARRDWTRQWWARATTDCELVTSVPVVDDYMQMQNRFAARLCPGPGNAREGGDVAEQDLAADTQKDARR